MEQPRLAAHVTELGREVVVAAARSVLDHIRESGRGEAAGDPELVVSEVAHRLENESLQLRPVVNATGILLHTGLGRAPLGRHVAAALLETAQGYSNLEFDLETGERGSRTKAVAALLREITGAEAAAVVNNNAGATLLALRGLAAGREVVVSRGQLVEIGGSFRLPEVFESSGARLVEVGTTNKTRLADYERAIGPNTAALLRVHPSNYQVVGFTESVEIEDLVGLARARGIACIDDIGSGALSPEQPPGLPGEPSFQASLSAGADLVLASGDKLLGGPQCGLIAGRQRLVAQLTADPLMRALRVDKLTLAALEAVLRLARSPSLARSAIPLWTLLAANREQLRARSEAIVAALGDQPGVQPVIVETEAQMGGGSVPAHRLPSIALRLDVPGGGPQAHEDQLARALRTGRPAIVPRVQNGSVWLDLKAVFPAEDALIVQALKSLFPAPEDRSHSKED
jgi:L-seryl-tRNA(Ser) seleniumtransferase